MYFCRLFPYNTSLRLYANHLPIDPPRSATPTSTRSRASTPGAALLFLTCSSVFHLKSSPNTQEFPAVRPLLRHRPVQAPRVRPREADPQVCARLQGRRTVGRLQALRRKRVHRWVRGRGSADGAVPERADRGRLYRVPGETRGCGDLTSCCCLVLRCGSSHCRFSFKEAVGGPS